MAAFRRHPSVDRIIRGRQGHSHWCADQGTICSSDAIALAISLFLAIAVGGVGWLPDTFIGAAFIGFVPNNAEGIHKGLFGAMFGMLPFAVVVLVPHGVRAAERLA